MTGFTKDWIVYGSLKSDGIELENVRCEIHLNRLDTSEMTADLFDTEGIVGNKLCEMMSKKVDFTGNNIHEGVRMNGQLIGISQGGNSDRIGRLQIFQYEETFLIHDTPLNSISFLYHITPCDIFSRKRMMLSHDMKGLLFGYNKWTDGDQELWKEDDTWYETNIGKFCFYPGLVFSEQSDGSYIVKEQLKVVVTVSGECLDYQKIKFEVQEKLKTFLHILSVIEGKFVNWFYCEVDARGETTKGFVSELYKRTPNNKYRKSEHLETYALKYKETLPIIVEKYSQLQDNTKTELDKAFKQALVASVPKTTVETKLLYWHSCLDILVYIAGPGVGERRRMGFSKSLVVTCEKLNIGWNDLYPYIIRDEIFSDQKADFKITTFRNNMIHWGVYPTDKEYQEVFNENSRAVTLFERMITKIMGLDYAETPLGKYRQFR